MLPLKKKLLSDCKKTVYGLEKSIRNTFRLISSEDMSRAYLKDSYPANVIEQCCVKYGLDVESEPSFIAWPVFLGEHVDEINICAVNLGISSLLYGSQPLDAYTKHYLDATINTLVVTSLTETRNGRTLRFWPTHIDYTNRIEYGTIIQSVITLSTLLKIGFLEVPLDPGVATDPVTEHRISFLMDALNWILYLNEINDPLTSAWSYAEDCIEMGTEKQISSAILPSEYSFEVLRSYEKLLSRNPLFRAVTEELDPTFFPRVRSACESYEIWFLREQYSNGGFRINSNQEETSFAFSCATLSFFFYVDLRQEENLRALTELICYLYTGNRNFRLPFQEVCDSYKFKYRVSRNEGYVNDAYEVFPEAVLFLSSSDLLERRGDVLPRRSRMQLRQLNYRCLESMLYRVRKIDLGNMGKNVVIEGRNETQGFRYPIYAIYYTISCLTRFMEGEERRKKSEDSLLAMPHLFDMKTVITSLCLIMLVGLACFLSVSDTLTSIILGAASMLAPFVFRMLVGEIHWLRSKD